MNQFLIFRHFWLLAVAATFFNALTLKFRSQRHIQERPELADGYRRFFYGFLFWGNLPWLVMGIGIELGGVPTVFSYFRPRDGNPFVLAWFASDIALWLLGFYWLFARRGAEFLIEYPGLLRGPTPTTAGIRRVYCLAVAGGVIGLILMFIMDVPKFPI